MWFKNIRAYRLTTPFDLNAEQLGAKLAQRAYEPCAKSQALSLGWVPPLGEESSELAHAAAGRLLLKLKREEKLLPASVVREQLEEKIADIQTEQGRKVYRKERLSMKDEIIQDCLPRAFSRSVAVHAYIDNRANWIFIDSASAARAEELLNLLRECIGSFPVVLPQVNNAPTAVMTGWLAHRNLPDDFALGEDCELREPGEEGAVAVREALGARRRVAQHGAAPSSPGSQAPRRLRSWAGSPSTTFRGCTSFWQYRRCCSS